LSCRVRARVGGGGRLGGVAEAAAAGRGRAGRGRRAAVMM